MSRLPPAPAIVPLVIVSTSILLTTACGGPSSTPAPDPVQSADSTRTDPEPDMTADPNPTGPSQDPASPPIDPKGRANPAVPAPNIELVNRLGDETSPYLLQHQHNPVAWYPWGPEAFEAARTLDRLIFLSVGYSTCYWCHVMERESFENEAIAAIMNEHFVCIKVDREERPDVDDIYMAAVQMTNNGQGGWPMSVFIEPYSLKPFLGATYFPPDDTPGRPGFPRVLRQMSDYWANQRPAVEEQCENVARGVVQYLSSRAEKKPLTPRDVEQGVTLLMSSYDAEHAGFVGAPQKAPKFPIPSSLDFLIAAGWDLEPVRQAVRHTLDRMATGGMYDQVGGGFHRYSVDREWLVPHFEKMLYDNGQLATTYAAAYEKTRDPYYAQIVAEICDYVLDGMTSPAGGFFSAQDAEVNHREGENYLWTEAQVRSALADAGLDDHVDFTLEIYGFTAGTNFTDPHHPEDGPKNVVFLVDRPDALAERLGLEIQAFHEKRSKVNEAMLAVRSGRDQPIRDDKVLTAWNGLMIAGMADAGRALNENRYRQAAAKAADFVLDKMRGADGGLMRTSRDGRAKIDAFSVDYAAMIRGLTALHRATRESRYLDAAVELADQARRRFWDEAGGYFDTMPDREDLFVRTKSTYDGAVPCANSVMANNLLDLHELTGDAVHLDTAVAVLEGISYEVKERPTSAVLATMALARMLDEHPERMGQAAVAVGGDPGAARRETVVVSASTRSVRPSTGTPASFDLTIDIKPGWHINAREPGNEFLIPLEILVVGGGGVELDVAYPASEVYDGPEGRMNVHSGKVTIPVTVRQVGAITGRPRLMIRYQACDDKMCLAPETERIPVGILSGQ